MTLGPLLVLAIFLVFLLLPVGLLISSTKNNILAVFSVLLGLLMTLLTAYSWFESIFLPSFASPYSKPFPPHRQ